MKAILIIDKPKRCEECPLIYDYVVYYDKCGHDMIDCPLKQLPQKKEVKEIKDLKDFVDIETQLDYITNEIVGKINYDVENNI